MSSPHYIGSENSPYSVQERNGVVTIKPQALSIIWGNVPRYWRVHNEQGNTTAELVQVCWLEVNGSIGLTAFRPNIDYTLQFKLELKPDAFGWKDSPVYLMVKVGAKGNPIWRSADLSQNKYGESFHVPNKNVLNFKWNGDNKDEKLKFGLYEVWRGRWKGGLKIEEVIISPCS